MKRIHPLARKSGLTLIVLAAFSTLVWFRLNGLPDHDNIAAAGAGPQSSVLEVQGMVVRPELFRETIQSTGNVMADMEIYVQPEASGRITGIYFTEDSEVREGDLLVRLNDAELRQEKRRISYQINLARIREQRQKELLSRNAIAQDDYDVALNELRTLEAQQDRVQAQIDKMEIRAPFDGWIGLREVHPGSYVSPQTVVSSLQKLDPLKIEFSIPERFRPSVRQGQNIRFQVEGSDMWRNGTVYAVQPRVDRQTRTVRIRARASNPGYLVFPGSFARVELDLRDVPDALLVPSEALVPEISGYKVFVLSEGRVEERVVGTGTRTDRHVMIREGLVPGDTVITTGLLQIRPGMPVNVRLTQREAASQ